MGPAGLLALLNASTAKWRDALEGIDLSGLGISEDMVRRIDDFDLEKLIQQIQDRF